MTLGLAASALPVVARQAAAAKPAAAKATVPVTAKNFQCAESDTYFAKAVKNGVFGSFDHDRSPVTINTWCA